MIDKLKQCLLISGMIVIVLFVVAQLYVNILDPFIGVGDDYIKPYFLDPIYRFFFVNIYIGPIWIALFASFWLQIARMKLSKMCRIRPRKAIILFNDLWLSIIPPLLFFLEIPTLSQSSESLAQQAMADLHSLTWQEIWAIFGFVAVFFFVSRLIRRSFFDDVYYRGKSGETYDPTGDLVEIPGKAYTALNGPTLVGGKKIDADGSQVGWVKTKIGAGGIYLTEQSGSESTSFDFSDLF